MSVKTKRDKTKMKIWIALVIGLSLIEFPGVFIINRIEPKIFGMPFIYGFVLIVWALLCGVLFYAYKTQWGEK